MDQGHLQLLLHYLKEPKVIADHHSLGRLLVEHRQLCHGGHNNNNNAMACHAYNRRPPSPYRRPHPPRHHRHPTLSQSKRHWRNITNHWPQ